MARPKRVGGLGFRKLLSFNISMVAKQGWRLISEPNSLMARIMKARYYPNKSFETVGPKKNASTLWQGLLEAQHLINSRLRRRICNGQGTKIGTDPWLISEQPRITTHLSLETSEATVDGFFVPGKREWDTSLINDLFNDRDMSLIFKIPLSEADEDDKWMWEGNHMGIYKVKDGYKHLIGTQADLGAGNVNWKSIWNLNVPPKIKIFVWRSCLNNLPVAVQLLSKRVNVPTTCQLCEAGVESLEHIFLECNFTRKAMDLAGLCMAGVDTSSFKLWWKQFCSFNGQETRNIMVVILWSVWCCRKRKLWEAKATNPPKCVGMALSVLDNWTKAQGLICNDSNKTIGAIKWRKPESARLKCNFDASIFSAEDRIGFGLVMRHSNGGFLLAVNGVSACPHDPLIAEALAFKEALSWCKKLTAEKIELETDSASLVAMFQSNLVVRSYVGGIMEDCKKLIKDFRLCELNFIYRSVNQVAHRLARVAISASERGVWEHVPPPFIHDVLDIDLV